MAITVLPHIRASWGGTIGTPASEVWTNSIAMMAVTQERLDATTGADLASFLVNLKNIVIDWFTANSTQNPDHGMSLIGINARLSWVKLNYINAEGHYRDNPNTLLFDPITGPTGSSYTPIWQQSSVISLHTSIARGRGSRGRLYPPLCGTAPNPDGHMDASLTMRMQQNAVQLLGNLNKVIGDPGFWDATLPWTANDGFNCAVVSNASNGRPPLLTPITSITVDQIPDVQRRRVNRVPRLSVAPTSVFTNS